MAPIFATVEPAVLVTLVTVAPVLLPTVKPAVDPTELTVWPAALETLLTADPTGPVGAVTVTGGLVGVVTVIPPEPLPPFEPLPALDEPPLWPAPPVEPPELPAPPVEPPELPVPPTGIVAAGVFVGDERLGRVMRGAATATWRAVRWRARGAGAGATTVGTVVRGRWCAWA